MPRKYLLLIILGLVICAFIAAIHLSSNGGDKDAEPQDITTGSQHSGNEIGVANGAPKSGASLSKYMNIPAVIQTILADDEIYFASDSPAQRSAAKIKLQGARYVLIEESGDDGPVYAVIDLAIGKIVAYIPIGAYAFQVDNDTFAYIDPSDRLLIYRRDFGGFVDVYQAALGDDETFNSLTDYTPTRPLVRVVNAHQIEVGVFSFCTVDSSCGTHVQRTRPLRTATIQLP